MKKSSKKRYRRRTQLKYSQKITFVLLAVFFVTAFFIWWHINKIEEAVAVKVIDGDTIVLDNGETVRYLGVDTPEVSVPVTPVECFGPEATERNKWLVDGKRVKLVRDLKNKDKYGRLLRYVYVDEQFINLELVRDGYARVLTVYPNVSHSREFAVVERQAEDSQHGLWSQEKCAGRK